MQDRFNLNKPYFPRSTLQNFLSIPHIILVALIYQQFLLQSCNIKLISRQQALGSTEEMFSSCLADRLPISRNKVLSAFQSSIFDFTDKSRTLNFILSLPNQRFYLPASQNRYLLVSTSPGIRR